MGQVVLSKQGKDVGRVYVVVGNAEEDIILLADAKNFNISRPKRKNPKHLQPTRLVLEEVRKKTEVGQDIDYGMFRYLLQKSEQDRKVG